MFTFTATFHRLLLSCYTCVTFVVISAGVTPPYQHFESSLDKLEVDWRWAAGATPFGPYSNYEGVSEIMQVSEVCLHIWLI